MAKQKILCSFKIGDRVVHCPTKTRSTLRGCIGTVHKIIDNLFVEILWDERPVYKPYILKVISPIAPMRAPIYNLKLQTECHACKFRLTHLVGGICSVDWKEVQAIETKGTDGNQNTSSV